MPTSNKYCCVRMKNICFSYLYFLLLLYSIAWYWVHQDKVLHLCQDLQYPPKHLTFCVFTQKIKNIIYVISLTNLSVASLNMFRPFKVKSINIFRASPRLISPWHGRPDRSSPYTRVCLIARSVGSYRYWQYHVGSPVMIR